MIRGHHATTKFTSEIGIGLIFFASKLTVVLYLFRGNILVVATGLEEESLIVVSCCRCNASLPEPISIVAIERQHLAKRYRCGKLGPACTRVEGQVKADPLCDPLQRHEIGALAAVFIVELAGNNRTTVFPLQSLHLGEDLPVELLDKGQEARVLTATLDAFCEEPVGYAAIAHLAVAERTQTKDDRHLLLLADFQEVSKVAPSTPVPLVFQFLHMVPKSIGGNHRHAAGLHVLYCRFPLILRQTRIVYLTHDRHHTSPVDQEALGVPGNLRLCPRLWMQGQQEGQ